MPSGQTRTVAYIAADLSGPDERRVNPRNNLPVPTAGWRRMLGWCAVAGPVLFTAAWLVAGSVQAVYSPRREDISALAALDAQHAWIMIAGIVVLGLGLVALGVGLVGAIDDGRGATV